MDDLAREQGRFVVAVGAIIEDPATGQILLLKRSANVERVPGMWEGPAGRMQQGEDPEMSLRREIEEECGIPVEIIKPLNIFHEHRKQANGKVEVVGIIYWCRAKSLEIRLSDEHCDCRWLLPEEALALTEDAGVRDDIRAFVREAQRAATA